MLDVDMTEDKENEVIPTDTNLISEVTIQDQSEQNLSKKEIYKRPSPSTIDSVG